VRQPDATEGQALAIRLRPMEAADLDEVMRIENLAFRHPWSVDLFRRELTHPWSTLLVAEAPGFEGARMLGFVVFWLVHDEIHILNICTDPAARRLGVAKTLLRECLSQGKQKGAALATLEVRRSNTAAIRLYESFSFRQVGIRPKYYAEDNEDAIVMLLDLV